MKNKKVLLIVTGLLLLVAVLVGVSYAYYLATVSQQGVNTINTDCFALTFEDEGQVVLNDAFPIRDSEIDSIDAYHFKIKNICNQPAAYQVNLDILSTSNLDIQYLNYKLDNGAITSLSSATAATPTATGATSSKLLTTGSLLANEEVEYDLKVWLKEAVTTSDPVQNKSFKSKIVVNATLDKDRINIANTINSIVVGSSASSTDVIDKGNGNTLAYDGTTDNNLRYVGANPSNYVKFNNELWRIIGVMNNIEIEGGQTQSLVKIIRNDALGVYAWDSSDETINGGGGLNQWGPSGTYEGVDLMRELNTDYLGTVTVGTDGNWYNELNNQKIMNMPSTSISGTAQSMIESVVWNLGSPANNNGSFDNGWANRITPSVSYTRERTANNSFESSNPCNDTVTRTSNWTGKIALIYPSDYGFSTAAGNTTSRATCLSTTMYQWDNSEVSDCKENNWLYKPQIWYWTISPSSSGCRSVFRVGKGGTTGLVETAGAWGGHYIYPTLYLKSSVKITSGTGTQADPYILSL